MLFVVYSYQDQVSVISCLGGGELILGSAGGGDGVIVIVGGDVDLVTR